MKRIIFLVVIFLSVNLFAQDTTKVDSTLYKKYSTILKQIENQMQQVQTQKDIADGKFLQSMQALQTQKQIIDALISDLTGKLPPGTYTGKTQNKKKKVDK